MTEDDFDPQWDAVLTRIANAQTDEELARIAAGPLTTLWFQHRDACPAGAEESPRLAALIDAITQRSEHAARVMDLFGGAAVSEAPPKQRLGLPNVYDEWRETDAPPPTAAEQAEMIEGYLNDPDEWWEALDEVGAGHPGVALQIIRAICADPRADLSIVGAGPLETLACHAETAIRDDLLAALETDERLRAAFRFAYLFSLSDDFLDALAARLTSAPLRPTFTP